MTKEEPLDLLRAHDAIKPIPSERRCARCLSRFRPKTANEFICIKCVDKKSHHQPEPEPELESVWDGKEGLSGGGVRSTLNPAQFIGKE